MKMSFTELFLADVQKFVSETGTTPSALGLRAVGDGSIIAEIRNNQRSPTLRTADRIYRYMNAERARRAEPGARCATACLSEGEAEDREAALERGPTRWAWFIRWWRS